MKRYIANNTIAPSRRSMNCIFQYSPVKTGDEANPLCRPLLDQRQSRPSKYPYRAATYHYHENLQRHSDPSHAGPSACENPITINHKEVTAIAIVPCRFACGIGVRKVTAGGGRAYGRRLSPQKISLQEIEPTNRGLFTLFPRTDILPVRVQPCIRYTRGEGMFLYDVLGFARCICTVP
jgi:hypothetical protein